MTSVRALQSGSNFSQPAHGPARAINRTWSYKIAVGTLSLWCGCILFAGAYVVKSATGVDMMSGPSPMHQLVYLDQTDQIQNYVQY